MSYDLLRLLLSETSMRLSQGRARDTLDIIIEFHLTSKRHP